jgi:hypothetical protein
MTLTLTFQGEVEQALKYLERGMEFHFGNGQQLLADTSESAKTKRKTYAQVKLPRSLPRLVIIRKLTETKCKLPCRKFS